MEKLSRDMKIGSNYAEMKRFVFIIVVVGCFFEHLMAQTLPVGTWTVKTDSAEYVFGLTNKEYNIKANLKDDCLSFEMKGDCFLVLEKNQENWCVAFRRCNSITSNYSSSALKNEIKSQTFRYLVREMSSLVLPIDDFEEQLRGFAKHIELVSEKMQREVQEINGHIAVDLGLSVKWATCNVGASYSAEYGYSLEWGVPSPDMQWSDRYQGDSRILPLKWDAANQNWGGNWRMPTGDELEELITKCTWVFQYQGKVGGYFIIGPNENSIFLPMAGNGGRGGGWYWSSASLGSDEAYGLHCWYNTMDKRGDHHMWSDYRSHGFNIRPVIK